MEQRPTFLLVSQRIAGAAAAAARRRLKKLQRASERERGVRRVTTSKSSERAPKVSAQGARKTKAEVVTKRMYGSNNSYLVLLKNQSPSRASSKAPMNLTVSYCCPTWSPELSFLAHFAIGAATPPASGLISGVAHVQSK